MGATDDELAAALRANEELRRSDEAHRLLFEASPLPLLVFDVDTLAILAANEGTLRLYGYERDELMRTRMSDLARDDHEAVRARTALMGDGEAVRTRRNYRRDGAPIVVEFTSRQLSFEGHRARITVIKDITERYEAEQTRALLAAIVESSNDAIVSLRLDGEISSWNDGAARLFGYAVGEAVGKSFDLLVPTDRVAEERLLLGRVGAGERVARFEAVRRRKDGTELVASVSLAPIMDGAGKVVGVSSTAQDLTSQRKAEDMLERAEEQLRQSQKMEAVGRLAGGVAHDFNNVLCVILSYSEMIATSLLPSDHVRADVEQITKAAERAAALTRQLLLFSRQKAMMPRVLDVNEILSGMGKMLRRLLGEDVDLVVTPGIELGHIQADPGNVEQVIMNLVVNARDAMPTGGQLTIETRNVDLDGDHARANVGSAPGPHVMLAVSDSGTGMDKATQARIFEPFFTTKEAGKGTGLGLSTVFGIAQRSGGSVWVYSELGKGTAVKVYFPCVMGRLESPGASLAPTTLRGHETILLVEDEEQLRTVAEGILRRSGYRVIVAEDATKAMLACASHQGAIDMLLTDVVMPQMSGPELAKRLAATRPSMRVLCMSGYADDSIVRHGVLESGVAFLQKPFTPDSLTRKVREVLNASSKRSG